MQINKEFKKTQSVFLFFLQAYLFNLQAEKKVHNQNSYLYNNPLYYCFFIFEFVLTLLSIKTIEFIMNSTDNNKKVIHQGKNAKKFRETKGVKQETIAQELEITQQAISQLERRQELDDKTIEVYARIIGIDEFFIRNMPDDSLLENTSNFYDQSSQILNFNPLDKVMELCTDKDELYKQNAVLQERFIENEKEKFTVMYEVFKEHKDITDKVLALIDNISKKDA